MHPRPPTRRGWSALSNRTIWNWSGGENSPGSVPGSGKLSRERVYRRPWLCIYEAYSHSWFGELDDADRLLEEAEKRIRADPRAPDAAMLGQLNYVRSRVTAMRGDLDRAIEYAGSSRDVSRQPRCSWTRSHTRI